MRTIHEQIQDYIHGNLSDEQVDHLWMNFLCYPLWYDYFITELTAQKLRSSPESATTVKEFLLLHRPAHSGESVSRH